MRVRRVESAIAITKVYGDGRIFIAVAVEAWSRPARGAYLFGAWVTA